MRLIIVTGANNGIGLALTRALLGNGDRVAAIDLALDNLPPATPTRAARWRVGDVCLLQEVDG